MKPPGFTPAKSGLSRSCKCNASDGFDITVLSGRVNRHLRANSHWAQRHRVSLERKLAGSYVNGDFVPFPSDPGHGTVAERT